MFSMNLTCKEFVLLQRFPTLLSPFSKLFSVSSQSTTERNVSSVNKSEYIRYKFPEIKKDLVDVKQQDFDSSFSIIPDVISVDEELQLISEIEKSLKRLHYQHDHWDDVNQ